MDSYYRLGMYISTSSTNTQTTVSIQVWLWTKWSLTDNYNTYYFNNNASSATTLVRQGIPLSHTVSNGAGWSTSNQTKLGEYSYTYNRTTVAQTIYCAAKIKDLGTNDSNVSYTRSYTIPALASYTVTYNANGGTGVPSSQTKWYGKALTISSTKPTRTGYSFLGWNTSSTATTASYASGASYTSNAALTLYAVWKANTYIISYDANGGTGAPSNQSKTHGVALTLSSTVPSRTDYNFLGWGTSASATKVMYTPSGSYTTNAAVKLYAIWELAYSKPRITGLSIIRCTSDGAVSDTGTYSKVTFNWATDYAVSSISIKWKQSSTATWSTKSVAGTGTSGSVSEIIGNDAISTEHTYDISISVADSNGITTINKVIPGLAYAIDILRGGKGVSIGKPAEKEGFDIGMTTYIDSVKVTGNSLALKGRETIKTVDDDTTTNWGAQRNSIHYYGTKNLITDQPSQYGFLVNYTEESNGVFQLWKTMAGGNLFHRGGNQNGWVSSWRTILDSNNYSSYALPITGGTVSGYTKLNNSVNAIGYFRLHAEWIGMHSSSADAQNNTNRKGWFGYDGTDNFSIVNNAGGSNITNKAWTTSSDKRLKTNVDDVPDVFVDIWNELLPKVFKWNELNPGNDKIQFGLIAQDVMNAFAKYGLDYQDYGFVVPYKMKDDDTEYFSITYDNYHMLTAMVLRKTNARLEEQQKQIDSLKEQFEELRRSLYGD